MASDLIFRCAVCEQEFRPEGLDKEGRCAVCRVKFPKIKNKKELMMLNQPEIQLGEKLTVEKVRQIIKEELNTFMAERQAAKLKDSKDSGGKK